MQIIEITVRDRVATKVGDEYYVCGNSDYVIHFDFDEEWDALDIKTARFIAEGNILYPDQIFSGSECPVPVISNTNNIKVGVFAGNLQTTTPARIPAYKSILCGTSTPAAPEEDAYHQAMEEMSKVATEARTKAAEAAQSAEESAQSAAASAQSAVEADTSAQTSAQAAEAAGAASANADTQAQAAQASAQSAAASAQTATAQADDAEAAAKSAEESKNKAAELVEEADKLFIVRGTFDENYVTWSDRSQEEIRAAVKAGKTCILIVTSGRVFTYFGEAKNNSNIQEYVPTFIAPPQEEGRSLIYRQAQVLADGKVSINGRSNLTAENPYSLTFTGAVSATYNGSSAVTVEIPEGGSGGSASREVVILPETALTAQEGSSDTYLLLTPFENKPTGDMLCMVTYNGADYACTSVEFEDDGMTFVVLGNFAPLGEEDGNADAPFTLICVPDGSEGMYGMMLVTDAPGSVTVSITALEIDEGVLAYVDSRVDGVLAAIPEPEAEVLTVTGTTSGTSVTDLSHTYAEITEAVQSGKEVQMVLSNGTNGYYALPLITWLNDTHNRKLVFQTIFYGEDDSLLIAVDYNDLTGTVTLTQKFIDLSPPKKGVDYWTAADKAEMVEEVIAALDAAEGVNF